MFTRFTRFSSSRTGPWWLLVGWTVVLWLSRLRNVVTDEDLSAGGRSWRVAVVVVFVGLAVANAHRLARPSRWSIRRAAVVSGALLGWTATFWIVRGGGILLDDHDVGFKIVHTVLAAVSLGLVAWVIRHDRRAARVRDRVATR